MVDADNRRELAERAEEAARVLDEPLLARAFADIESDLIAKWDSSALDAVSERERAWMMLQMLRRAQTVLRRYIEIGRDEAALKRALAMPPGGETAEP